MKTNRFLYIVVAILFSAIIFHVAKKDERSVPNARSITISEPVESENILSSDTVESSKILSVPDVAESPQEIIRSIYDFDRGFQESAQAAAEGFIAPFSPGSVIRWRPVRLEPGNFLTGSYLEDGSMRSSFQITPFPEAVFKVVEKKYTIRDWIESAHWEGSIVGSIYEYERVDITVVGGVDSPKFIIKIINGPQIISIVPTDTPDVYVAIEANPNRPPSTL